MKEKMKKLILLTFYKDKSRITNQLQELGVLHIETPVQTRSDDLEKLIKEVNEWKRGINILKEYEQGGANGQQVDVGNADELKERVFELERKKSNLIQKIEDLAKQERLVRPWGQFSWQKIQKLNKNGIYVQFFTARKNEYYSYDFDDSAVEVIREGDSKVYLIVFDLNEEKHYPFEKVKLPESSLDELSSEKINLHEELKELKEELGRISGMIPEFDEKLRSAEDKLANKTALESFEEKARGKIDIIKGWFPEKRENQILKFINENNLSFEFRDPEPGDDIPVILRNKKYPKIFEQITGIFQLPNYYEFDLTPFIAVFYPIFFAYCLGDAGYGLILVLLSVIASYTFLSKVRQVAMLGMILGIMTTFIGIVKSGTIFGIPILENTEIPFFGFLSKYVVVTDNQNYVFNAFNVALMIGVVQIIVGILISIFKKVRYAGFIQSLSTVGKLFIIISLIILFLGAIQDVEPFVQFAAHAKIVLIAGIALVLFFHDTQVSLTKRIGSGFLPLYFIVTGLLGDVLSYIRLFALGVASSILGLVVNQIGSQIMEDAGIGFIILGVVFLVVGHTLNFLLACLGSFVHPLRLTFVEFYNNAEFKGGGIEYKPFKRHIANEMTELK